jgi:MFS family permease
MVLGQRTSPATIGVIASGLLPVSILLFAFTEVSMTSFLLFALLYGAGNGAMTIVRGTVPVEFFGRAHYGAVNGALAAPVLIAKAFGPLVAAMAWSWTRDYDSVAAMLGAVGLCSLAFFALAMRSRRS